MRAKLIFSLSVMIGLDLFAFPGLAQEDSQDGAEIKELNSHLELNLNDDKTLILDSDAKPSKITPALHDSSPVMQVSNPKKQEQQKPSNSTTDKSEEDPLSFNFLYFIIQKFKISDILDE